MERRVLRKALLALSGGGYNGLFTARYLAKIEAGRTESIGRSFDLIAGTSIGGIIALGLATDVKASKIAETIEAKGPLIFQKPTLRVRATQIPFMSPPYRHDELRQAISEILPDAKMGDLSVPTLVSTMDLVSGNIKIFRSNHWPSGEEDKAIGLRDVALATASAPTYFPPYRIGDGLFVDGGVFANVPDILAVVSSSALPWQNDSVYLLSVGTTETVLGVSPRKTRGWGMAAWLHKKRLIRFAMAGQSQCSRDMASELLPKGNVLVANAYRSNDQEKDLALDDASPEATAILRRLADQEYERHKNSHATMVETFRVIRNTKYTRS